MTEPSDEILRRWLLHALGDAEAGPLEARLLEDDAFGARVREAETDLLDDFARGRLDERDRAIAAARFGASTSGRLRVRIAAALARVASTDERGPRRHRRAEAAAGRRGSVPVRRRLAFAAALLASVSAVAVIAIGLRYRAVMMTPAGAELTIALTTDRTRGADIEDIRIPAGVGRVRLQAEVDPGAGDAFALTIDPGTAAAFTAHDLLPRASGPYRFVEAIVPASVLAPGVHRIALTARGEPAGSWQVRASTE